MFPSAFEVNYLEKMEPSYAGAIENCLDKKVLIVDDGRIFFNMNYTGEPLNRRCRPWCE